MDVIRLEGLDLGLAALLVLLLALVSWRLRLGVARCSLAACVQRCSLS